MDKLFVLWSATNYRRHTREQNHTTNPLKKPSLHSYRQKSVAVCNSTRVFVDYQVRSPWRLSSKDIKNSGRPMGILCQRAKVLSICQKLLLSRIREEGHDILLPVFQTQSMIMNSPKQWIRILQNTLMTNPSPSSAMMFSVANSAHQVPRIPFRTIKCPKYCGTPLRFLYLLPILHPEEILYALCFRLNRKGYRPRWKFWIFSMVFAIKKWFGMVGLKVIFLSIQLRHIVWFSELMNFIYKRMKSRFVVEGLHRGWVHLFISVKRE